MSHIWVPKFKIIEGEFAPPPRKLRGFYTMTRRKADTLEEIQTVGPFENLITNYGLNLIGTAAPSYAAVGTGTASPSASDTQLQSEIVNAPASLNMLLTPANWPTTQYCSYAATTRFDAGTAAGNLAEVGVGDLQYDAVNMKYFIATYSRARIVDGSGDPTTITVLPDEVLDVTYELRHYLYPWEDSSDDVDTTLTLSGVSYDIKMRPLNVNSSDWACKWNATLQAPGSFFYTGIDSSTPVSLSGVTDSAMSNIGGGNILYSTPAAYVDNSYTRKGTFTAGLSELNFTYGISGLGMYTCNPGAGSSVHLAALWQATVTPAIPKDDTKILSFGVSYSWARYTP